MNENLEIVLIVLGLMLFITVMVINRIEKVYLKFKNYFLKLKKH